MWKGFFDPLWEVLTSLCNIIFHLGIFLLHVLYKFISQIHIRIALWSQVFRRDFIIIVAVDIVIIFPPRTWSRASLPRGFTLLADNSFFLFHTTTEPVVHLRIPPYVWISDSVLQLSAGSWPKTQATASLPNSIFLVAYFLLQDHLWKAVGLIHWFKLMVAKNFDLH